MTSVSTVIQRLNAMEALVVRCKNGVLGDKECDQFLEVIRATKDATTTILKRNETEASQVVEAQNYASILLLKDIDLKISESLRMQMSSGLQEKLFLESPGKIKSLIEQLEEDDKISNAANAYVPVELINKRLNDFYDVYLKQLITPKAVEAPDAVRPIPSGAHKRSRRIDITDRHQELLQLIEKVSQQKIILGTFAKDITHKLSDNSPLEDALLRRKQVETQEIEHQVGLSNEESDLNSMQLSLMIASKSTLFTKQARLLSDAQRLEVANFAKVFILDFSGDPKDVTEQHCKELQRQSMELLKQHGNSSGDVLVEKLIKVHHKHLQELKQFSATLESIGPLVSKRLEELEQRKIELGEIQTLQRQLGQINTQILGIIQTVDDRYAKDNKPTLVDHDTTVKDFFDSHQKIHADMLSLIDHKEQVLAKLSLPEAYLEVPLETDRLKRQVEILTDLLEKLKQLEERQIQNHNELSIARRESEKGRLAEADSMTETLLGHQDKLNRIAAVPAYQDLSEEIEIAQKHLNQALESIMTSSRDDMSRMETVSRWHLNFCMEQIEFSNKKYLKEIVELGERIDHLQKYEKNTTAIGGIDHLQETLGKIKRPEVDQIEDLDIKGLETLKSLVLQKENLAREFTIKIENRQISKEVTIFNNMVKAIKAEKASIQLTKSNDPRVPIFEDILKGLQQPLDRYLTLKTKDQDAFIAESLGAIKTSISGNALKGLSAKVSHPLVTFIRTLLEPVHWLLKKIKGETYSPGFFAEKSEETVATAAEKAHLALSNLHKALDDVINPRDAARGDYQPSPG